MTTAPLPRRDDPRMHTVEMAAVSGDLEDHEILTSVRPGPSTRGTALLVAAGGALGATLRYLLELAAPTTATPTLVDIPWSTWTANVLGCLLMGVIAGYLESGGRAPAWARPFLATGLCGGFTTMSTLVLQVSAMIGADFPLIALEYGVGSAVLALLALVVGLLAGRILGKRS